MFFVPYLKSKFRDASFYESVTIDRAPHIEQYIDMKTNFQMENRDTFQYMSSKADDDSVKKFAKGSLSERVFNDIFRG